MEARGSGGLVNYTVTHFANEERLFDQHGYPEIEEHKEKHKKLIAQVTEFYNGYEDGTAQIDFNLMTFLRDWLNNHIKGVDQKYGSFFNSKGIK